MSLTHIRSGLFFIYTQGVGDFVAENYENAERDYLAGAKYKDIAAKYGVTVNTVKSWKIRYGWSRKGEKSVHTNCTQKSQKCAHKKEEVAPVQHCRQQDNPDEKKNSGLSENQRLFCLYYVKYRNQVKAYQKAYQCSHETASAHAYKVWRNVEVQTKIKKLLEEVHEDIKIDMKDLIQQQIDIARADITDFVDINAGFVTMKEDMDGTLIREIKNTQSGVAIKLYDKQKAIDWIAKNMSTAGSGAADDRKLLADVLLESKGNRSIEDIEGDNSDEHSGTI